MATRKSADMMVVACRLPHGLVIPLPGDESIKLNGLNAPGAHSGHGFTNLKRETWETIKTVYGHARWFTNQSVFAFADADSATDAAEDRQDVNVGFNQVDPNKPNVAGVSIKIENAMPGAPGSGAMTM